MTDKREPGVGGFSVPPPSVKWGGGVTGDVFRRYMHHLAFKTFHDTYREYSKRWISLEIPSLTENFIILLQDEGATSSRMGNSNFVMRLSKTLTVPS